MQRFGIFTKKQTRKFVKKTKKQKQICLYGRQLNPPPKKDEPFQPLVYKVI